MYLSINIYPDWHGFGRTLRCEIFKAFTSMSFNLYNTSKLDFIRHPEVANVENENEILIFKNRSCVKIRSEKCIYAV